MILTRETVVEHFKNIKGFEDEESAKILEIRNNGQLTIEQKKDAISSASFDKEWNTDMKKYELLEHFKMADESEGYISVLAELNINVYTRKDHDLLKNFLKEKGFESNVFNFEENVPAFKAMIGSNNDSGLKELLTEVEQVCGENNIYFSNVRSKYNDGAENVKKVAYGRLAMAIMTKLDSPIVIGSKVDDVINFNVGNGYNFSVKNKTENDYFLSYEKPVAKNDGVLDFLIKKLPNKIENDYKEHMLERNLSMHKNGFMDHQKIMKELGAENVLFEPEKHKISNPKLSILKCYQMEAERIVNACSYEYMATYGRRKKEGNIEKHKKMIDEINGVRRKVIIPKNRIKPNI